MQMTDLTQYRPRLPWRWTHLGGLYNTMVRVPRWRRELSSYIHDEVRPLKDDVTVVIGVKNRVDYKLSNTLKSISLQVAPGVDIRTIVVDYDNEPSVADTIQRMCAEYSAQYMRVSDRPTWCKPHCYNVAIKRAVTKYLMSCDADILLAQDFIEKSIEVLTRVPLSVVYSQMLDLPESSGEAVEEWGRSGAAIDLQRLRRMTTPRSVGICNEGIFITYSCLFKFVRGYDEFYEEWGYEDSDVQKRFQFLGLEIISIKDSTFYLHQWHPKFQSLDPDRTRETHERNRRYFNKHSTVIRNPGGWGDFD